MIAPASQTSDAPVFLVVLHSVRSLFGWMVVERFLSMIGSVRPVVRMVVGSVDVGIFGEMQLEKVVLDGRYICVQSVEACHIGSVEACHIGLKLCI
jgi:hypothetical protein